MVTYLYATGYCYYTRITLIIIPVTPDHIYYLLGSAFIPITGLLWEATLLAAMRNVPSPPTVTIMSAQLMRSLL